MVDVKNKRCQHDGCMTRATFDHEGCLGRYCKAHAVAGMVDVRSKRCDRKGCTKQPHFDQEGGKGRYCKDHAEAGMVNVKDKRCEHDGCMTRARYGCPGNKPVKCNEHKESNMICQPRIKCINRNCKELAMFAQLGNKQKYCQEHVPDDSYVNIIEQRCISCELPNIVDKYGKCQVCDPDTFTRGRLAKQNEVEQYLKVNASDLVTAYSCQVDKMVDRGICGRERPDFLLDAGDRVIILEVDENQHKDRACECEQTRMVNIAQSHGGISTIFIRYNPDDFKDESGENRDVPRKRRMDEVIKMIRFIISKWKPTPGVIAYVTYMYYDGKKDLTVHGI